ncbi:MAG: basic secretory protein-like protein [Rhodothermales bacterium]
MMRPVNRLFTLVAVLAMLVVWATPAAAQYFGRNKVQYDNFDFKVFETEHFIFHYYPESEQAVKDAARMAERWYRRHSRTFAREFKEKKPIIFYANDADFHQTNAIRGSLGEGTGGVTESLKERVIMPLTGVYADTDHVLGHELVHSFQYDTALNRDDSTRFALGLLPLWMIEGTAEYFSIGRQDAHTAMWMRDAALRDDLPSMKDLNTGRYFPYRYGQAYMAYIGGKYGDAAVANLYKLAGRTGLDSALVYTLGIESDSLSKEWAQSIKETYLPLAEGRTPATEAGKLVLSKESGGGRMNLAPALSPDGKYVAFISERDLVTINLFIADAETGEIIKRMKGTNSDTHFDAIRFISSAGSWSPDGKQFAFVTFSGGDNEIAIFDVDSRDIVRRFAVNGVGAMTNPAWSPDGGTIAFSGIRGGISNLYTWDMTTSKVQQLTNDRYADLQPTWSPDGKRIAFTTDRGENGSNFDLLSYSPMRIGIIDLETSDITSVVPFGQSTHHNPQFAPDGRSLYFISDQDGFKDIYRYDTVSETTYRITNVQTGVSGISSHSPAMSVAAQNGRMAFTVYSDNTYPVYTLEPDQLEGTPIDTTPDDLLVAAILPPTRSVDDGLVGNYLSDPLSGLPADMDPDIKDYSARLKLDYVAPPTVGVSTGGAFGSRAYGGVAFFFSDMLGNHNLTVVGQANGTFKDIGAQVSYMNLKNRLNFGGYVGHVPLLYGYSGISATSNGIAYQQVRQRIFIDQVSGTASYPFTTTRRLEVSTGMVRYGFDYEVETFTQTGLGYVRQRDDLPAPDPVYFFQSSAALVGDYSSFGFTSPIRGGRYRLAVSPYVGTENFTRITADYRKYLFANPITVAFRGLHVGNYGADINNPSNQGSLFTREFIGYANTIGFVRGYNLNSFGQNECTPASGNPRYSSCAEFERLFGTHYAMASAELRVPFLGTEDLGIVKFPYLPTEISLFTDAGLAWDEGTNPFDLLAFERETTSERIPVVSSGVSARMNVLGYIILEVYYAYPFQRPERGAHFGFQLVPGW